jgi:hypothetical protein
MRINFLCPSCSKENVFVSGEDSRLFCEHCHRPLELRTSGSIERDGIIDRCVVCGKDLFYIQKDFNRALGCAIMVVGAIASIYTYGASLLVAAAIDWHLYYRLPEVTVCYYCNSLYRGYTPNPKHKGYDLSIGELVESNRGRPTR